MGDGRPQNGPANLYAFGLPVPGAARAGTEVRGGGWPARARCWRIWRAGVDPVSITADYATHQLA